MGNEIKLDDKTLITSKTTLNGIVTYCNKDFLKYSGYSESEILGKPHNKVRHESMPRAVFALLWETIKSGEECFAFVKNKTKDGGYYWVFANITPSFDTNNQVVGYYSVRRKPNSKALAVIDSLYKQMKAAEKGKDLSASRKILDSAYKDKNLKYNELILKLQNGVA